MGKKEEPQTEAQKKEKEYNKWKSRRWLICCWAMLMVTFIVILGITLKNDSYAALATTLVAVPVGYVSLETVNKWKRNE